ncbi:hypothetical protein VTL71DRAFT_8729 [Oculimacula yallundae]|uniref:Pheromone receptor n=1 Tax=Oculimacula yallundae TaxID=86028 RepID=A0ABR4CYI0_9HELO
MENTDIPPTVTITDFIMPTTVANPINAIALPIFAFLALLITYLPLRSFYRVKNIAACSIMFVLIVINLMALINGIIWPTDDWTTWWSGYGLCDVEVLIRYPITMALATSLCCLSKGLADALDTEHAVFNQSVKMRRRKMVFDVLFCWGVPVMQMALHYTVQAGRYMVVPVWGCTDQLDNSWPVLLVIIVWCPIFALLNVYYAALMLIRLHRYRLTISAALSSTGSGLPPNKFLKLAIISLFLIIIYLPLSTFFVYLSIPTTLVPYSWSRIHNPETWSPILFIHTGDQPSLQWFGWAGVAVSGLMFAFFGFNDDAVDTYRAVLVTCGMGMIWPGLKLSREERRARSTLAGDTLNSRGSFMSQLDLVGKAMKYFDAGSRKGSSATGITLVNGTPTITSRKGSQGTFTHTTTSLSHIPTNTSLAPSFNHQTQNSTFSIFTRLSYQQYSNAAPDADVDAITPAPSHFNESSSGLSPTSTTYLHPHREIQTPSPTSTQSTLSGHRGIFSVFRTHLNIPSNIFATSPSPAKTTKATSSRAEMVTHPSQSVSDIEVQTQSRNPYYPRRPSSIPSQNTTTTTVSSKIWSKAAADHKPSCNCDPHSPKLGTRAYRERERRELKTSSHLVSEDRGVLVGSSLNTQAKQGGEMMEKKDGAGGMGGVLVRRSLDIVEERTA